MKLTSILFAFISCIISSAVAQTNNKQTVTHAQLVSAFQHPPEAAKPWVFWYWMQGAVSKEGITADLQAMKSAGIGGAYLMFIKDTTNPPLYQPSARQLSPQWWKMVKHAMEESKRVGLKLAMHVSDGFALAGGPWITPELSMQKVVWTQSHAEGGKQFNDSLPQPETLEGYYRDIAVYAFPSMVGASVSTRTAVPKVTTSKPDFEGQLLVTSANTKNFGSDTAAWIQYEFDKPFTCRSIVIHSKTNYQVNRLIIEVSDDGKTFTSLGRFDPPRHGWQDWDADYTHAIPSTTARFFRFVYDKSGSEPGAEDLDAAKWKPSLKVTGIELLSEPRVHQYEGKNGEVWRISKQTTEEQLPDSFCVPLNNIINLTDKLDKNGKLVWDMPAGNWTIIRMGHTSTGHKNDTGGGGKGLECDKFNTAAIELQFDKWFGEIIRQAGPALARNVLKVFHVDSWECGSQNWSPVFREEFKKRRGYDLINYLPVTAGIPVESADASERFLHDVRETIAELINDKFYGTFSKLAHAKGCIVSAESVAPTMVSDGMLHYKNADIPMGEFWLRSPTHDKPNDMLDAISGAHVYGKNIVQAEAFTELRMAWDEHPGMLKTLADRNFALGINRLSYHVFMHNPWMNRKPGITLDAIGLLFQRDQTWWKQGRAWVEYAQRCQALLQIGKPVTDIAVFTGEELPRRSILPDRLVLTLPGIFGEETVKREAERLANKGEPLRELPAGVRHSANMSDAEDWVDPLHGYAYDSFNPDVLLSAKVNNGRVEFPGGASYGVLVLPQPHAMASSSDYMSLPVAQKLNELVKGGASIIVNQLPEKTLTLLNAKANDEALEATATELWAGQMRGIAKFDGDEVEVTKFGTGRVVKGPYHAKSFETFGILPDVIMKDEGGNKTEGIAWTHRTAPGVDIYFFSNQKNEERIVEVSLRVPARVPELWDPVTDKMQTAKEWKSENYRTILPLKLAANGSMFIVLTQPTSITTSTSGKNWAEAKTIETLAGDWKVRFDSKAGGPKTLITFNALVDWSKHSDSSIRYYSGTAAYSKTFDWKALSKSQTISLDLGNIANIAEVRLNGIACGITWTPPYKVDITKALKAGRNELIVEVTNTWANRLIGDHRLTADKKITSLIAPDRLEGKPLLPAGLLGPVRISSSN